MVSLADAIIRRTARKGNEGRRPDDVPADLVLLEFSRTLNPSLRTFDEWLAVNGKRIPIGKALRRAAGA